MADNNADYITLPNSEDDKQQQQSNDTDASPGSDLDDGGQSSPVAPFDHKEKWHCWWMEPSQASAFGELVEEGAPFPALLGPCGIFLERMGVQQYLSVSLLDNCSLTDREAFKFAGMLIDCTRLAVHAGRFDVAHTLRASTAKVKSTWETLLPQKKSKKKNLHSVFMFRIFSSSIDVLKGAVDLSFAFNADASKSQALVSFETQTTMAFCSFFYRQLDEFLDKVDVEKQTVMLQKWLGKLEVVGKWQTDRGEGGMPRVRQVTRKGNFENRVKSCCDWQPRLSGNADSPDNHLQRVFGLIKTVQSAIQLKRLVAQSEESIRDLIDAVLYPSLNVVQVFLGSTSECSELLFLRGTIIISYVVLGVLECTSARIGADHQVSKVQSELRELHNVIDKVLTKVRSLTSSVPMMDLLLSPVLAANVALAATAKLYDKAHKRLEDLLVQHKQRDGDKTGQTGKDMPFVSYSELLWSQLIQLRATLPTRNTPSSESDRLLASLELPPEINECHEVLSSYVSDLGVFPHHVMLANDWNIVVAIVKSGAFSDDSGATDDGDGNDDEEKTTKLEMYEQLGRELLTNGTVNAPGDKKYGLKITMLEKNPLQLCSDHGEPLEIRSSVPHSLLLAGARITELNLSSTDLRRLPHHFGLYFPNLKRLLLANNQLDELPNTMQHLAQLEELFLGNNELAHLPDQFGLRNLTVLSAPHNRLTQLPTTIQSCVRLERLDLTGNPMGGPALWSLAAQLPQLREILPESAATS